MSETFYNSKDTDAMKQRLGVHEVFLDVATAGLKNGGVLRYEDGDDL